MTRVLDQFVFGTRGRKRHANYEWDEWSDGRIWQIDPVAELGMTPKLFQDAIHNRVSELRRRGKVVYVNTSIIDGLVTFRIQIDGD